MLFIIQVHLAEEELLATMSGIDCPLRVICQKDTAEDLCSPTVNNLAVYNTLVANYEKFKRLDSIPVPMKLGQL